MIDSHGRILVGDECHPSLQERQQLLEISSIHSGYFTEMLPWQRGYVAEAAGVLNRRMQEKMKGKVKREMCSSSLFSGKHLKVVKRFCF